MLPRKIKGKCIIKFQRSIDMRVIRTSKYRHAHITNAHFPSFKKGCFLLPLMSCINLFSRDCWLLLITHINSRYARGNLIILIFKVIDISKGAGLTVQRISELKEIRSRTCRGRLVTPLSTEQCGFASFPARIKLFRTSYPRVTGQ